MAEIRSFGPEAEAITLKNDVLSVTLLSYGATIHSILYRDRDGKVRDLCLGYDDLDGYRKNNGYFGAAIGRNGNRIGGARFTLNGKEYVLTANERGNQLHGGFHGLNEKLWPYETEGESVTFRTELKDGEEGYPGNLQIAIRYSLEGSALKIGYSALSDADTLCNLTNHCYFNLNGQGSILDHDLQLESDCYTEVDNELIPTGNLIPVEGSCMDFRTARVIGKDIHDPSLARPKGYDHNFCLRGDGLRRVATLHSGESGIFMDVETTLPGVQVYAGCCISPRTGKNGAQYEQYGAVCLETQNWPDAIHHENFPDAVLPAGKPYETVTVYRFYH